MKNRNGLTIGEFLIGTVAIVVAFCVVAAIVGPLGPPVPSSSYSPSYTAPVSSSSDGLDWDAARRAGYSEADIEAAKSLNRIQQMDNSSQEDTVIYNTLKQMGYSDADARYAVEASR
jgi:hypothetical protein